MKIDFIISPKISYNWNVMSEVDYTSVCPSTIRTDNTEREGHMTKTEIEEAMKAEEALQESMIESVEGLKTSYEHIRAELAASTKRYEKYAQMLKEVCVADNMKSLTIQSDDETRSEHASRTRWQFWNSVAEVMNAPSNVEVGWFVCHTNRVLWSMASQGYRRADGVAFLDEVANSGKFPDSYIKKACRSLDKYWKTNK